jgi:hypothetical protein
VRGTCHTLVANQRVPYCLSASAVATARGISKRCATASNLGLPSQRVCSVEHLKEQYESRHLRSLPHLPPGDVCNLHRVRLVVVAESAETPGKTSDHNRWISLITRGPSASRCWRSSGSLNTKSTSRSCLAFVSWASCGCGRVCWLRQPTPKHR